MPPLVGNFILLTVGALMSLPCVRGGAVLPRGGGVVPDTNYLFLLCKLQTFTIPQALWRQLPLHKGAFLVCANIAGDLLPLCGNSYLPALT